MYVGAEDWVDRTGLFPWDSRIRGCFAQVQLGSQWQVHLHGHASETKAESDSYVSTAAQNSPAAPQMEAPSPVSTFSVLGSTSRQLGKSVHPGLQ